MISIFVFTLSMRKTGPCPNGCVAEKAANGVVDRYASDPRISDMQCCYATQVVADQTRKRSHNEIGIFCRYERHSMQVLEVPLRASE